MIGRVWRVLVMGFLAVLGWVALAAALVNGGLAGAYLAESLTRQLTWTPALGVVVEPHAHGGAENSIKLYAEVAFLSQEGQQRRAAICSSLLYPHEHAVGEHMPLLYSEENPHSAVEDSFSSLYALPATYGAAALIWACLARVCRCLRRRREVRG